MDRIIGKSIIVIIDEAQRVKNYGFIDESRNLPNRVIFDMYPDNIWDFVGVCFFVF